MVNAAALSILAIAGILTSTVLCGAHAQNRPAAQDPTAKALVQKMCVGCHSANVVTSKRATPSQWSAIVQQMVSRGAEGTDEQVETVVRYLSENYGPQSPKSQLSDAPSLKSPQETKPVDSAPLRGEGVVHPTSNDNAPRVNVNTANARELASLLGLTGKEAQTLIWYREQNGNFKDWQEVAEVPGVPAGRIQDVQHRIAF